MDWGSGWAEKQSVEGFEVSKRGKRSTAMFLGRTKIVEEQHQPP